MLSSQKTWSDLPVGNSNATVDLTVNFIARPQFWKVHGKFAAAFYCSSVLFLNWWSDGNLQSLQGVCSPLLTAAFASHQSGGLGVPSSNLGAPTIKTLDFVRLLTDPLALVDAQKPNGKRQNHHIGDEKSRTKSRTCLARSRAVPPARQR